MSMYKPRRKHPSRRGSKAWHVPQISGSEGNAFWGFSSMGQKPIQGLFLLVVEVYVKRGCARSRVLLCSWKEAPSPGQLKVRKATLAESSSQTLVRARPHLPAPRV